MVSIMKIFQNLFSKTPSNKVCLQINNEELVKSNDVFYQKHPQNYDITDPLNPINPININCGYSMTMICLVN